MTSDTECVLCDLTDEQVREHLAARKGGHVCDDCYDEAKAILLQQQQQQQSEKGGTA